LGVDERGDRRITAQFVQAAAAAWPDAACWDAERGADLRIRRGRVAGERGDELLAAAGKTGERVAQRGVPVSCLRLLVGYWRLLVGDALSVQHVPGGLRSARCAQGAGAFGAGRGGQPVSRRNRSPAHSRGGDCR
jgi:hypothetical protein